MKQLSFLLLGLLFAPFAGAQTSDFGKPVGATNKLPLPEKAIYNLPKFNNEEERVHYANEAKQTGYKVGQYGTPHEVQLNFFKVSQKTVLPNGNTLYQYRIKSKEAVSLNVIFSKFHLAEGTTLHIIAAGSSEYIGAYTSLNNSIAAKLGTDLLYSDDIIVEVNEPAANKNKSELEIGSIIHGFTHLGALMDKALNSSGSCNFDVNCPQGKGWEICRNSVGMIMNGSGGFCSGAMVNNTAGTNTPYFLTAHHCGNDPSAWIFRFRWESPEGQEDCATSSPSVNGPTDRIINGAIARSNSDLSDFKLVELNSVPDPTWQVIYAGWDRGNQPALSSAGIHHPAGDIKKISISNQAAVSNTYNTALPNGHWKILWDEGVTEGGSSGSPIFNEKRRIVGQLNGGASGCFSSNQSDSYGKFFFSWTGKNTSSTRLSDWLDPAATGATFVDANVLNVVDPILGSSVLGLDKTQCSDQMNASLILTNGGTTVLTSATINYQIDGFTFSFNWTGSLGLYESDTIVLPTQTVSGGNHTFSASVSNPNAGLIDQNTANNSTAKTFMAIVNAATYNLEMNLDCYASETSWEILDASNTVIHASPAYESTGAAYTVNHGVCLNDGCYQFKIYDDLGDGMTSGFCQSGSYYFTEPITGDTTFFMDQANADFGSSKTTPFCVTYANVKELKLNQTQVYPNPSNQGFTIQAEEPIASLAVYDISGKLVYERTDCNTKQEYISFQFQNGTYFLKVKTDKSEEIHKLIKIN